MKHVEIEILSETTNCPVVTVPGRKYPGVVLQGDSLKNLLELAEEVEELSRDAADEDLRKNVKLLREQLSGYVVAYEVAMKSHGRSLPYV